MPRPFFIVLVSDAFVGIGTALELAMIWQLLQVRKLTRTPRFSSAACGPISLRAAGNISQRPNFRAPIRRPSRSLTVSTMQRRR